MAQDGRCAPNDSNAVTRRASNAVAFEQRETAILSLTGLRLAALAQDLLLLALVAVTGLVVIPHWVAPHARGHSQ